MVFSIVELESVTILIQSSSDDPLLHGTGRAKWCCSIETMFKRVQLPHRYCMEASYDLDCVRLSAWRAA
jgi:hypothetical protein